MNDSPYILFNDEIKQKFLRHHITKKQDLSSELLVKYYNPINDDVYLISQAQKKKGQGYLLKGYFYNGYNWRWGTIPLNRLMMMILPNGEKIKRDIYLTSKTIEEEVLLLKGVWYTFSRFWYLNIHTTYCNIKELNMRNPNGTVDRIISIKQLYHWWLWFSHII